jgi:hypothetical protein
VFSEIHLFNDNVFQEITSYIRNGAGENIVGKLQSRRRERTRGKGERVRDCVLLQKGFDASHKFDRWPNFSGLRKGYSYRDNLSTIKIAIRLIEILMMVRVIIKFKRCNFLSNLQFGDMPQVG